MAKRRTSASEGVKQQLDSELRQLQNKSHMGHEVTVQWQPSAIEYGADGRKLTEIVTGDTIFIFSSNLEESMKLLRHGFMEWVLSQHTKPYLRLINKLITLYEEQQYLQKEKTIEALLNLF
jgi:hypothetical protein